MRAACLLHAQGPVSSPIDCSPDAFVDDAARCQLPSSRSDRAALAASIRGEQRHHLRRCAIVGIDADDAAAWRLLCELFACHLDERPITCSAATSTISVPATTGWRLIERLEAAELIERSPDPSDRRRPWLRLRPVGLERMRIVCESRLGVASGSADDLVLQTVEALRGITALATRGIDAHSLWRAAQRPPIGEGE